jgi:site-specific DNA recombinase
MHKEPIPPIDTTLRSEHTEASRLSALQAASNRAERRRTQKTKGATPARDTPIAFLYLRVSTKEQARTGGGAEGYSIPAQRDAGYLKADALGAVIAEEYVDAGESAKSADRDDLQRMLKDIKTVRPDYVIVHKIDRLARNRADDIAINLLLKKHGVTLVSCTENIDDTPSGRLLYGLMAEIAQFYSGNLALEVMKGLVRKAEEGGTPFRAPLGYLNRREARGGVEYSWVELDPERADIVRWCFEQYATGEWSGIDLVLAAREKGLTNRPRGGMSGKPIGLTGMYHMLQNPYYMGVVSYKGIHYEGKHPVLVEPDMWLLVQDILAAHTNSEKDRVHSHYLRGTIYCSSCGARLVYSQNKGNGGTYTYYFCVKKKTRANNCTRPAMRVERIEEGIAAFYRQFRITLAYAEQVRQAVRDELAAQQADARRSLTRATKRKQQVQDERQKLLRAHYAGAVPQDPLASEMKRLTRELAEAEAEIMASKTTNTDIETKLDAALKAAGSCETAYLGAPDHIRRQINQGFFEKLYIGEDGSVERVEFTEPFRALLDAGHAVAYANRTATDTTAQVAPDAPATPGAVKGATNRTTPSVVLLNTIPTDVTERTQKTTVRDVVADRGLNQNYMVGAAGFEPATFRL